jgi:choline-sulfatase
MPARYRNLLILCSDEHDPRHSGFMGSPLVRTPHLDRLAAGGTVFERTWTPSPICVPARASLATGRWVHQHRCWDNAIAYDGRTPSWGHRLQQAGVRVESIGKLHYRSAADDTGFDRQQEAVHIAEGKGQVWGCVRDPLPERNEGAGLFRQLGAGETEYNRFDMRVAEGTVQWLRDRAALGVAGRDAAPAVLFAGIVAPHFPLVVPQQWLDLYPPESLPAPKLRPDQTGYVRHPWVQRQAVFNNLDNQLGSDARRRLAVASYFGLVSFMDAQMGKVLDALDASGLRDETLVLYISDHGDNLGARAMWNKSLLYRESTAVPMVLSGPGVARRRCATNASLVDVFPTVLDAMGVAPNPDDADLPGRSLLELGAAPEQDRAILSEYHAVGSPTGAFMLVDGRYKYHHYVDYAPELFDLHDDPEELHDLAASPAHQAVRVRLRERLRSLLDPEAVDRMAKDDQNALVDRHGGREAALSVGKIGATPVPPSGRGGAA